MRAHPPRPLIACGRAWLPTTAAGSRPDAHGRGLRVFPYTVNAPAEILRLRQILDLTDRQPPVLFLIDELLNGTNSHDRRIGAEAILRGLVERGSMGLATTHDLALSAIGEELSQSANVHFEDTVADGKIHFDYQMRPGVVTRSNALELMRSIGLPV